MSEKQLTRAQHRPAFLLILTIMAVTLAATPVARALETGACRIEVLVDQRPLAEYAARGTTYIEALKGREYAIRLSNRTDSTIAVALAVDGLNSIDAKTTDAKSASKWVLGPRETVTIEGWQMSAETARRFFFTTEAHSYGEWLGRTENLGVIEAVVFKELRPREPFNEWLGDGGARAPQAAGSARRQAEAQKAPVEKSDADDLAATGIGRKVDHQVRRVHLELEDQPAARLRLRYEYREQLVRLGVVPNPEESQALDRRERARGFEDFSFAPDPFAGGR
jgi:hypothetical protein